MMERYVYKERKKLRLGYTTGACAAAAVKAAAQMLLTGKIVEQVELATPAGTLLRLRIEQIRADGERVRCAVRKDAGDDHDVTDGAYIHACVEKIPSGMEIDGGEGVGRVTRPGLDQPVGSAAINSVPRRMMAEVMREAADGCGYEGGLRAVISVPAGEEIAARTLNGKLGIVGGISILGTSGIVEPMSEQALLDTIRAEISMHSAEGERDLVVTPGNYGETFVEQHLGLDLAHTVKCGNFIGSTIDMACEFRLRSLLFVGHLGKLVKLGSGIMNTHSSYADGRMETLAACVLLAGGDAKLARSILFCNTTDEAAACLREASFLEAAMAQLMTRIHAALRQRADAGLSVEAVVFSNRYGILGMTEGAEALIGIHRSEEEKTGNT